MTASSFFKKTLLLFFSVCALSLTACTGMNSNFSCPMQPGVQCNSLDQVNTMIDQGKVGKKTSASNQTTVATLKSQPTLPIGLPASFSSAAGLRSPESVMRIWVAPYQDQDGNYYQPGLLYSVVKPGQWVNMPTAAVN